MNNNIPLSNNIEILPISPIQRNNILDSKTKSVVSTQVYCSSKKSLVEAQIWEHALIGVSPFNSYFTLETLENLFSWALKNFKNIQIFIPTNISAYTFQALGYPENRAMRKTKKQDSYLTNKVIRALMAQGLSEEEIYRKIVCIDSLNKNEEYLRLYERCKYLFKNDPLFREGCLSTSEWVLSNKGISEILAPEALEVAVQYFLAELPLFLDTPRILNISTSTFVYKEIPAFVRSIYENSLHVSEKQFFLTVFL